MKLRAKPAENMMALIFLAVFLAFAVTSFSYGARARLVPVPIAILGIVLAVAQFVLQNTRWANKELSIDTMELFGAEKAKKELGSKEEIDPNALAEIKIAGGKPIVSYALPILYLGLIVLLGMHLANLVFVTGYFRILNKAKWVTSLLYGVGTVISVYLMFVTLLEMQFEPGVLWQWLGITLPF